MSILFIDNIATGTRENGWKLWVQIIVEILFGVKVQCQKKWDSHRNNPQKINGDKHDSIIWKYKESRVNSTIFIIISTYLFI